MRKLFNMTNSISKYITVKYSCLDIIDFENIRKTIEDGILSNSSFIICVIST